MTGTNLDQVEYWNGEVGQRWAANQAALDAVFAPLTEVLFERAALRPGAKVLDVGCGAGETALIAARRLGPRGRVLASDISAPLLAVARSRARRESQGGAPIEWIETDAQSHDFGTARFEHALSRFGVMFFADSQRAFANIRRALAPGGTLTFLCWRSIEANPWVSVPRDVVLRIVPDFESPAPDTPGPFRFADGEALVRILEAAGFDRIACDPVDRPLVLARAGDGSPRAAAELAAGFVVRLGPVSRLLREREPALYEAARNAVTEAFLPIAGAGTVALDAACWLVSATA